MKPRRAGPQVVRQSGGRYHILVVLLDGQARAFLAVFPSLLRLNISSFFLVRQAGGRYHVLVVLLDGQARALLAVSSSLDFSSPSFQAPPKASALNAREARKKRKLEWRPNRRRQVDDERLSAEAVREAAALPLSIVAVRWGGPAGDTNP